MADSDTPQQRRTDQLILIVGTVVPFFLLFVTVSAFAGTGFSDNNKLWNWLELASLPAAVALLPLWMRYHRQQKRAWILVAIGLAGLFIFLEIGTYFWKWDSWTGFGDKALWDWLQIVLVPFALTLITAWAATESALSTQPRGAHSPTGPTSRSPRLVGAGPTRWSAPLVALALILVALALWLVSSALHGSPATAHPPASAGATPNQPEGSRRWAKYQIAVPGTAPWTSTNLLLQRGQAYVIHADGQVSFIGDGPLVGPDGDSSPHPGVCVLPGSANHSGLIGRINETEMGVPFLVGSNYAGVADRTGILILGINDTGVDNNAGAFTATIEVEEPASSSPTPSG